MNHLSHHGNLVMINLNKIASSDPNISSTVTPEIIYNKNGDKEWRVNGLLHREDGPAVEMYNGDKAWYLNNKQHREDGPAAIRKNGDKKWYLNGKLHREDGPAVEYANGDKYWYLNNKQHREDGPAVEQINGIKAWYLNNDWVEYDPKTWDQKVEESHIENLMNE